MNIFETTTKYRVSTQPIFYGMYQPNSGQAKTAYRNGFALHIVDADDNRHTKSEGAVRLRLKKLKDSGVLKIRALINPDIMENQVVAMVAVSVAESAQLETKAKEISALDNVLSVSIITGRYDLLVEVLVDSNRGLVKFLTGELSRVKGVASTESFLTLKGYNKYV